MTAPEKWTLIVLGWVLLALPVALFVGRFIKAGRGPEQRWRYDWPSRTWVPW